MKWICAWHNDADGLNRARIFDTQNEAAALATTLQAIGCTSVAFEANTRALTRWQYELDLTTKEQ